MTSQSIRAIAQSIERLTALCDALEIVRDLQSSPDCSAVAWRILQRIAERLNREIKIESEAM